jgi:hypothetical protein
MAEQNMTAVAAEALDRSGERSSRHLCVELKSMQSSSAAAMDYAI